MDNESIPIAKSDKNPAEGEISPTIRPKKLGQVASFTKYLKDHPSERLYQALRNWSGADFILFWKSDTFDLSQAEKMGMKDTFYFTKRDE